jgi:hypothetical protein
VNQARDEALADAGLAIDEHRDRRAGDARDRARDLLRGGRHSEKRARAADRERSHLVEPRLHCTDGADAREARAAHATGDEEKPSLRLADRDRGAIEPIGHPRPSVGMGGDRHGGQVLGGRGLSHDDVVGHAPVLFARRRVLGGVVEVEHGVERVGVKLRPARERELRGPAVLRVVERGHQRGDRR